MLTEQRHLCESNADTHLGRGWRDCDKSELFRKALELFLIHFE